MTSDIDIYEPFNDLFLQGIYTLIISGTNLSIFNKLNDANKNYIIAIYVFRKVLNSV